MEKVLSAIYNYFEKHRTVFFISIAASFIIVILLASRLKFEEDISKILPKDKKIEKLNEVFQNSKFLDKLVLTISLQDTLATSSPDSLVTFADTLVSVVQQKLSKYIARINYRVDDSFAMDLMSTVTEHIPIFLDDNDYRSIDSLIQPAGIKHTLEKNIRTLTSPAGIALKNIISKDPVGISLIGLKKLQQLQYDDNFGLYDSYIVTKDYKHLMLFITPAYPPNNTGMNGLLLKGLDHIIDSLHNGVYKNIEATYFGATAVSAGNAEQLRKDMFFTQGITIIFLIVFIGLYFRKKRAPFIIMVPVVFGALFSLAAIYLIKGSISVIALGTGSVVLGIAVNYSLHVFNHYRHTKSIADVIKDLAQPLTIGSFTTIGGFLCLEFVESEMLKDLGLFAAFSLIGASLCSLIFLPQFIATKKEQSEHKAALNSWIDKIASYRPEYNKRIVVGIFLLTVIFAYTARKVSFESDMMHMNFMSDKLKTAERNLNVINVFSLQSVYLVSEGKTFSQALENNEKLVSEIEKLKARGIVKKYSGVSSLIISDSLQQKRIDRWNAYWTPKKKQQLFADLDQEGNILKFRPVAFESFKKLLNNNFQVIDSKDLKTASNNLLGDFITETPGHATVVTLVKVTPGERPALYKAFENNPAITVIDKQYLTSRLVDIINTGIFCVTAYLRAN
jgi:predicted exporter